MNKIIKISALCLSLLSLSACNSTSNQTSTSQQATNTINLEGVGRIYLKGTQYLEINIQEENKTKLEFKEDQKNEYYTLSSSFAGKSITNVKYQNKYSVLLTVDGTVTSDLQTSDEIKNAINISSSAFTSNNQATCSIKYKSTSPQVKFTVSSFAIDSSTNKFKAYTLYIDLPYGTFNKDKCTNENITVKNGTIELITPSSYSIQMTISNITDIATITMKKEVSSFNTEITKDLNFDTSNLVSIPALTFDLY